MATFQKELYLKEPHILKKKKKEKRAEKKRTREEKEKGMKGTEALTLSISDQSCLGCGPCDLSAKCVANVTAQFICSYKAKRSLSVCLLPAYWY